MEKEPIESKSISPKVAFFLSTVARNPDIHLRVKSKGLTAQGESYFNERLNKDMRPLLKRIREDKTINQMAHEYLQTIQPRLKGGTDILNLEYDRIDKITLFDFLEKNDCHLDSFMKDIISTELAI